MIHSAIHRTYWSHLLLADFAGLNLVHLMVLWYALQPLSVTMLTAIICINLAWMAAAWLTRVYSDCRARDMNIMAKRSVIAFFIMALGVVARWLPQPVPQLLLIDLSLFGTFLVGTRLLLLLLVMTIDRNEIFRQDTIVIGYNNFSQQLVQQLEESHVGCRIKGFFDDNQSNAKPGEHPLLGSLQDCVPYAVKHGITEIYSTILPDSNPTIFSLAKEAENNFIRFHFVPDLRQYVKENMCMEYYAGFPVLSLRHEPLARTSGQLIKRLFDIVLSSFIIVFILSWLAPIIALLIKLESRGPVLFKQVRTGQKNKPFVCLKFRSLKVNDDADSKQVTRGDSRMTKVGAFLRKTNLDELPQFFNVLAGQMSIVGSRPHMLKHTEDYSRLHDRYMLRHLVKPGVTGWAQVNGFRGEIRMDEQLIQRVEHDLWYIENWSLWLDIRIVCQTFVSVFKNDKNAF